MPNAAIRKQFPGGAVATTTSSSMTAVSTSVDIAATAGWPTGPTPWVVTINRGGATEEQVLVSSRSSSTLSFLLANRGYGATTAFNHNAGESIEATIDPTTVDEVNRVVSLPANVGEMLVFDGTNIVVLSAPSPGTQLEGVDAADDPRLVKWNTKWIPVSSSAPAIVSANGQQYYDSSRDELMTTVGGVFQGAALGVVVFDTTGARDSLFGSGPAGRLAWITSENRMYVGTGTAWIAMPQPGEFVYHFAGEAEMNSSGMAVGCLAMTDDDHQLWLKRTSAWYSIGVHFHGSIAPPTGDVADGDIWTQPV